MAGRIRNILRIVGSRNITKILRPKENSATGAAIGNVNEIKGLDNDGSVTCRNTLEMLVKKIDHLTEVIEILRKDIKAPKETIGKAEFRPMPWESDIKSSMQRVFYLEWKLEAMEKGLKRNNIMISGLEIGNKDVCESVRSFLQISFDRYIGVSSATLQRRVGKPPLIIAVLMNATDKMRVLAERTNLKGTGIYINSQETMYDREVRRQIKLIAKEQERKGKVVVTRYRKLVVDGVDYVWKHGVGLQKVTNKDSSNYRG